MNEPRTVPERLEAVVHGRVQGVGFRMFVAGLARELGLGGWVANQPDRSVRCVAEGPRAGLERLLAALHQGPAGARVDRVEARWAPASGDAGRFEIRSGWHGGD